LRRAHSLAALSDFQEAQGKGTAAEATLEEALGIYRALDYPRGVAAALTSLGELAAGQGDLVRARSLAEDALRIRREQLAGFGTERSLLSLGALALAEGDVPSAGAIYQEAADLLQRDSPDSVFMSFAIIGMGDVALRRGNDRTAFDRFAEALANGARIGDMAAIVGSLDRIASLHDARRNLETAARLGG